MKVVIVIARYTLACTVLVADFVEDNRNEMEDAGYSISQCYQVQ